MGVRGYFVFNPGMRKETRIRNTLVNAGARDILKLVFQNSAITGVLHMGLSGSPYDFTSTLVDISVGEPVGNGYLRAALTRNGVEWDVSKINGIWRARSLPVQFVATAAWTKTWIRAFLSTTTDNSGDLYAVSGPQMSQQIVTSLNPPLVAYEFWLRA